MATNETLKIADATQPRRVAGVTKVCGTITIPTTGDTDNGDNIVLFTAPKDHAITDAWFYVDGTLGAACTIQLRVGTTAISAASTAAAAGMYRMTVPLTAPLAAAADVNLLIGGADVGTAADVTFCVEVDAQHKYHTA